METKDPPRKQTGGCRSQLLKVTSQCLGAEASWYEIEDLSGGQEAGGWSFLLVFYTPAEEI